MSGTSQSDQITDSRFVSEVDEEQRQALELHRVKANLIAKESDCNEKRGSFDPQQENSKRDLEILRDLHTSLLYNYFDFFVKSQHHCLTPVLKNFYGRYDMPQRMWHVIEMFLRLLREELPASQATCSAFLHTAYNHMFFLCKEIKEFEDVWIEYLGILAHLRMIAEGPSWGATAWSWYNTAIYRRPHLGILYSHLAELVPSRTLMELSLYTKALMCVEPYENARNRILTLYDPTSEPKCRPSMTIELLILEAHESLLNKSFSCGQVLEYLVPDDPWRNQIWKGLFRDKEMGVFAAISNIAALLEYGNPEQTSPHSTLRLAYLNIPKVDQQLSITVYNNIINMSGQRGNDLFIPLDTHVASDHLTHASRLASITLERSLKHRDDDNMYPLVHIYLVFVCSLTLVQQAWNRVQDNPIWRAVEKDLPWATLCAFLNRLATNPSFTTNKVWEDVFPEPDEGVGCPLPEDYIIRGQLYSEWYFPHGWFAGTGTDANTMQSRIERLLWLGLRIACAARWIIFNTDSGLFVTVDRIKDHIASSSSPDISG